MELIHKFKSAPSLRKVLIWTVSLVVAFTVTGFFILPPIVKSVLIKKLSEKLHREVAVRQVTINPYMLSATIRGFMIKERGGKDTFASFDELYLNLQIISIFKMGLVLSEIKVVNPYLKVVRSEDQVYNFSDLLPKDEAKPPSKPEASPLRFSLNNIQILNGRIDFEDGPKHTRHTVKDMDLTVPFISNLPYYAEIYVQPYFAAKINETPVILKGKTKPFTDSLETTFEVDLHDLDVPYYLAYVPFKMDFRVLSGYIDAKNSISYIQYKNKKPSLALTGDVVFKKIKVVDSKGGQLFDLPKIGIGISRSDLIERQVHLAKVLVESPEIDLGIDKKGRVNLMSLVPENSAKKEAKPEVKGKGNVPSLLFEVDEAELKDGKVIFEDFSKRKTFRTTLEDIEVKVAHFSNGRDKKTAITASLKTEVGETLLCKSELSVNPVASTGNVEVKGIKLKKYSPYYSDGLLFDIEDASLDLATSYAVGKNGEDFSTSLSELTSELKSLRMKKRDEKEDFLKVPLLAVKDTGIDLAKQEITVGEISTQKGEIKMKRLKDGSLNISTLVEQTGKKTGATVQNKKVGAEKTWLVKMKKIDVDRYSVRFEDLVPPQPVTTTAQQIRFRGEDISTAKNSRGKASVSFSVGKKGTISANGTVGVDPSVAALRLKVKDLDITPFQPYFGDRIKIIVTSGGISAGGALSVSYDKVRGPKVVYKGKAVLSGFASIDKANAEDFLKWESLYFNDMDIGYNPLYVNINEVALSDFYSRFIINPDGTLNVQGIIEGDEVKPVTPVPAAAPVVKGDAVKPVKAVKIGKVTLQGGTINFSDHFIKPNYSASFLEIGGRVSGLSSDETTLADVDLKGRLDNYAPLEITGKINPLKDDLYVDLKVDFRDMDLSPVTPYSGKFMGYAIQKGKLSLNLKYLIEKKKLDAQNHVFLDQFTLGDKIDSPDATKLPVRLAIALLKNRKGEIQLDIPVSGYINDPKFSVSRIVIKILVNLLAKAATSPFSLLGALFGGGGEELSYIDFDYGSPDIPAPELKKVDTLVKALYDRPALKLEIEGHVDIEKDREALRQYLFNKKIKAQKLKDMLSKGLESVPVDDVKVSADEYPKYLKMAYKAEKFPKPRNFIGIAKNLPAAEMEKLMLTHIEVKDDDLRQLASRRALNVRDRVLLSKQVDPEKVFLVEPKTLQPEKKEKLKDSRVDFKLK